MIDVAQRRAADAWFLDRGLPAVLRPGAWSGGYGRARRPRWRRSRCSWSIPPLVVPSPASTPSTSTATRPEPNGSSWRCSSWCCPLRRWSAGWCRESRTVRGRTIAATVAVAIAIAGGILGGPSPRVLVDLIFEAIVIAAILALTASGLGSILGWTAQMTLSTLPRRGSLLMRALPVLLLTILVFFNSPVWLMASTVSRAATVAGAAVPDRDRGGVRGLRSPSTGSGRSSTHRSRRRSESTGRHTVRDDARPAGDAALAAPSGST